MVISMDVIWNTYLSTLIAGISILVSVTVGFAIVGIVCNCCHEIWTRKEEQARRMKEQETERIYSIEYRDFLMPVAETP